MSERVRNLGGRGPGRVQRGGFLNRTGDREVGAALNRERGFDGRIEKCRCIGILIEVETQRLWHTIDESDQCVCIRFQFDVDRLTSIDGGQYTGAIPQQDGAWGLFTPQVNRVFLRLHEWK